jgi:hypothetical protein
MKDFGIATAAVIVGGLALWLIVDTLTTMRANKEIDEIAANMK